jgi:2-polyprenyl-6-methoxyphenol hydroxylase-like FAD-dependent oxidoreductase
LIAGGGIGGLTLALSLWQHGVDALVCESSQVQGPVGVGIMLHPMAMRELTALGLGDDLRRIGWSITRQNFISAHGQPIWDEASGAVAGYRWPQIAVHRGALQLLLMETARRRLGAKKVRTGLRLCTWRSTETGVIACFQRRDRAGHEDIEATVLIGADGINSACRQSLYPHEAPLIGNKRALFRGVTMTPPPAGPNRSVALGDSTRKLHAYPIGPTVDGLAPINWIIDVPQDPAADPAAPGWTHAAAPEEAMRHLGGWSFPGLDVPGLVAAAPAIHVTARVDRDPLPRWTMRRTTLIGDAAHPAQPVGANASTQAILDARVLARELGVSVAADALQRYETERRPQTERLVLANRAEGPDRVLNVVGARAPDGFKTIKDIISPRTLAAAAEGYRMLAGIDHVSVNRAAIIPVADPPRLVAVT